jgi:uncharacterized repeat protein (TIGR03803 family)
MLTRRELCVSTLLGAGLGASGLAEAKKPSFLVIRHFPAGESPTTYPLNSGDGHGDHNRLNIITATHGWRLNWNTGNANSNDAYDVHSPTCSHMIAPGGAEGGGFWPIGYGTETLGGKHGSGSVYWWYTSNRHYIHDLYTFDPDGSAGLHPMGGLIVGFDGAMYGTTHEGGQHGVGTIFRITTAGELTVLHHFDHTAGEGFGPTQCLTAGPDGHYYGVTRDGGAQAQGALYRMAPDGTVTTLFSFDFEHTGRRPHGALTLSPDGRLYGLARLGGAHGGGTLFALGTDGSFTRLHSFREEDGIKPMGSLYALPDGTLYGTCSQGGTGGRGTVFKFHPAHRKLVVRHAFAADGSEGATPMAGFCLASNGYLYSTCRDAGQFDGGTIFRMAP